MKTKRLSQHEKHVAAHASLQTLGDLRRWCKSCHYRRARCCSGCGFVQVRSLANNTLDYCSHRGSSDDLVDKTGVCDKCQKGDGK